MQAQGYLGSRTTTPDVDTDTILEMIDVAIKKGQPKRLVRNINILASRADQLAERIEKGERFLQIEPNNESAKKLLSNLKGEAQMVKDFMGTLARDYPEQVRGLYAEGLFGQLEAVNTEPW